MNLDIVDGKLKSTPYLLNNQNLRYEIESLLIPVSDVTDFDQLSIPFRSVAADIVNFKEVILSGGSLSTAVRASMSIPGVFEPVRFNNMLLIDGGISNNFPTDIAKAMGADIIIGSDVSGGGKNIDEFENVLEVILQTSMFANFKIYEENRNNVDILIDHIPNLSYSTSDFDKCLILYEEGKIAVNQQINKLAKLSNRLRNFEQRKLKLPEFKDEVLFDSISFNQFNSKNRNFIANRLNLKSNTTYTTNDLKISSKFAMGTNLLRNLNLDVLFTENSKTLIVNGKERADHQVQGALHYDLYRGVGIIGNYTGRNILGPSSRVLVSLDIAEQPKFLIQTQKNFGDDMNWWWRTQINGSRLRQNIFEDGQLADDFRQQSIGYNFQFNRNINPQSNYIGIGLNYNYVDVEPTVESSLNDNILDIDKYYSSFLGFDVYYKSNSFDKVFYPRRGSNLDIRISRSINQTSSLIFTDDMTGDILSSEHGFTQFNILYQKRLKWNNSITGIIGTAMGLTLSDKEDDEFYGLSFSQLFYLGGNLPIPRKNSISFEGLQEDELISSQFIMLKLGAQINFLNNMYVTPLLNTAFVGFSDIPDFTENIFNSTNDWQDSINTSYLYSIGAKLSYNSILGPVDFDIAYTNGINKLRLFLSIGIPFNR